MLAPAIAAGCSCSSSGPPCEAAWKASVVFVGTVVELTRDAPLRDVAVNGYLGTHAIFEVSESFIGIQGAGRRVEIRTGMGGGDCGYPFQRSQRYVVYAFKNAEDILVATTCSRTSPITEAKDDLEYLRNLGSTPPGYIFGVVGSEADTVRFDKALGVWVPSGISGAKVTVQGVDRRATAVTSSEGSFRLDGIPPGKYGILVEKDGYAQQAGVRSVDVHVGGCAYAWETLAPTGRPK